MLEDTHFKQPSFIPILTHAMLPQIVEQGLATVEEIEPDTMAQRIENEYRAVGGTIVWDLAFLVSGRVPLRAG